MASTNSSKALVQQINILSLAMIGGLVMLAVVATFINQTQPIGQGDAMGSIFLWIILLVGGGGVIGSNVIYNHLLSQIPSHADLMEKLEKFRTAILVKFTLIEVPALLSGVGYLMTGSMQFLFIMIGAIIFFWFQRPSRDKIIQDLSLSQEEQSQI